jgi:glycine hydroxymethyltransferase
VVDKTVADLIAAEEKRQREGLELIPSENYVSRDVLNAMGSIFTNKYSEGFPGKRYYGGQENTDKLEQLAIDRAKELFKADHANVQPHSGAPANEIVYFSWLEPGDTVLAMDLSHGGHLTHGNPMTRSAKLYNFVPYKMKDPSTGEIDYDELRRLAQEHKPKIVLAGFSAYPRELDYAKFAAHCRPDRRRRSQEPVRLRVPRHYHYHAQNFARPARRPNPDQRHHQHAAQSPRKDARKHSDPD